MTSAHQLHKIMCNLEMSSYLQQHLTLPNLTVRQTGIYPVHIVITSLCSLRNPNVTDFLTF